MNKENIIDYVAQTPHNPNKKVLDDMLETLIEENSGASSWNDLTDKPFDKEEILRFEWDGDLTNTSQFVPVLDGTAYLLKAGDALTSEQVAKLPSAEIKYKLPEGKLPYSYLRSYEAQELSPSLSVWVLEGADEGGGNFSLIFFNVKEENTDIGIIFGQEGLVVSDKGLYAMAMEYLPIELVAQNVKRIDGDYVPIKPTMQTILSTNNLATSHNNIIELERGFKYLIMLKSSDTTARFDLRGNDNKLLLTTGSSGWQTVEIYHGDHFYIANGKYCDFKTEVFSVTNVPKDISKLTINSSASGNSYTYCRVIRVS